MLTRAQWQEMLAAILRGLPEEACGMAAGEAGRVMRIFAITNELHSPVRFRMDPREQVQALMWMDDLDLDVIMIYHSHPTGPDHPSETDIAEWYYPESAAVIWTPRNGEWSARAFLINREAATYREIPLLWEENPPENGSL